MTGRVEQGIVKTGEEVEVLGIQNPIKTTVTGAGGMLTPAAHRLLTSHPLPNDGCMLYGLAVLVVQALRCCLANISQSVHVSPANNARR